MLQGLHLIVWDAIPCCYGCCSNPKAVAREITLDTRSQQHAKQPESQ